MTPVQLGLDVRRHLDPVDHQIADQPVDHGVLHDHPDQTGASQVALAELGIRQVLVLESRHDGSIHRCTDNCLPCQRRSLGTG